MFLITRIVLKTGFINKIGTLSLALTTKYLSKEFYVAAPSYKFIDRDVEFDKNFEFIDKDFVTAFIWEGGIENNVPIK